MEVLLLVLHSDLLKLTGVSFEQIAWQWRMPNSSRVIIVLLRRQLP
jgi:hypothetical protein